MDIARPKHPKAIALLNENFFGVPPVDKHLCFFFVQKKDTSKTRLTTQAQPNHKLNKIKRATKTCGDVWSFLRSPLYPLTTH